MQGYWIYCYPPLLLDVPGRKKLQGFCHTLVSSCFQRLVSFSVLWMSIICPVSSGKWYFLSYFRNMRQKYFAPLPSWKVRKNSNFLFVVVPGSSFGQTWSFLDSNWGMELMQKIKNHRIKGPLVGSLLVKLLVWCFQARWPHSQCVAISSFARLRGHHKSVVSKEGLSNATVISALWMSTFCGLSSTLLW